MNEREQRQQKLANLFFEMGMDLDLIEKVSGVDKKKILLKRMGKSKDVSLTFNNDDSNMYVENRNSIKIYVGVGTVKRKSNPIY